MLSRENGRLFWVEFTVSCWKQEERKGEGASQGDLLEIREAALGHVVARGKIQAVFKCCLSRVLSSSSLEQSNFSSKQILSSGRSGVSGMLDWKRIRLGKGSTSWIDPFLRSHRVPRKENGIISLLICLLSRLLSGKMRYQRSELLGRRKLSN